MSWTSARRRARLAGLDLGSIARQLEASLEGSVGGSLIEASEELPVRLRVGKEGRNRVEAIRRFDVLAPSAAASVSNGQYPGIPLTALGTISIKPAKTPIFRRDGERVNTVQGYVQRNVLPEEALKTIQQRIAESGLVLPAGYRFEAGGDADAREEVLSGLLSVAGIVVALTVATIVLTFNSFGLAAIAGAVIILSVGLSALTLAVFGYPFGIMAVIGLIGSIGVSINAAIIIITALQGDADARRGDRLAIRRVVAAQGRHIISTTVTTFGGFLPLILAGGGFWPPFAMAIAGGVLLSTIVSFYFVPPAFAIFAGRRRTEDADGHTGMIQSGRSRRRALLIRNNRRLLSRSLPRARRTRSKSTPETRLRQISGASSLSALSHQFGWHPLGWHYQYRVQSFLLVSGS